MKTNVTKLFYDYEKEENWINSMAAKGWNLTGIYLTYTFEEGIPGEYTYRMVLLEQRGTHPESINYIRFMEETGAEHVATYGYWIYFRKKTAADDYDSFQIYTDTTSRIQHYKRVARGYGWACLVGCISAVSQIPFAYITFFVERSAWGLANVFSGMFCMCCAYILYRPWAKLTAKARQLELECEVFE